MLFKSNFHAAKQTFPEDVERKKNVFWQTPDKEEKLSPERLINFVYKNTLFINQRQLAWLFREI